MDQTRDDLSALSLLDDPVRRALYDWVATQGQPVGREEAAGAVKISRSLATFHLDKLAAAGLLDADYRRLTGRVGPGAGRPARVYWRPRREFNVTLPARRYDRAAEIFARALERMDDTTAGDELRTAATQMGEEAAQVPGPGSPRRRLFGALARGGYEPELGEHGTIRLRNCPFHALVETHRPLVCGTNLAFAEGVARAAGVTDLVPVLDPLPDYCCVAFAPVGRAAQE